MTLASSREDAVFSRGYGIMPLELGKDLEWMKRHVFFLNICLSTSLSPLSPVIEKPIRRRGISCFSFTPFVLSLQRHDQANPSMTAGPEKLSPSLPNFSLQESFRLLHVLATTFLSGSKTVALALLPSFIFEFAPHAPHAQHAPLAPLAPDRKHSRTAYLDGLRGAAAWIVFVRHYTTAYQPRVELGYGQVFENEVYTGIMRLPFLRLLYGGPLVQIFFVVSGYVLALKPLRLIHERAFESLLHSLTVSVFGRGMRLFLPPLISTFAVMLAVRMHWYDFPYEDHMRGLIPRHPERLPTFWAQLKNWLRFVLGELTNPWKWNTTPSKYDSHLWTIPIQFKSAMILFLVILGLARARPRVRRSLVALFFSYCMFANRWDVAAHLGGMFLADLDLERQSSLSVSSRPSTFSTIFWSCTFTLGLYLGSFPRQTAGAGALGYGTLALLTPWHKHWHTLAAVLLVWSLGHAPALSAPFTSRPLLYLGKISFSLYIVHGPVLHTFGYAAAPVMWRFTGDHTEFQWQLGWALGLLVLSPLALWGADLFWRGVQRPVGEVVRSVEKWCLLDGREAAYARVGEGLGVAG